MSFKDFIGNESVVRDLRAMLERDRFPHALILSGPEGSGKYTLAQMLAKTMNCLDPPPGDLPDFCGQCEACVRIGEADDLASRYAEAIEAREGLREADKKDTRIFVQTYPDVFIIPPDPPQMMIKVDQVRQVTANIYFRPSQGHHKIYIFTDSCFMKEAANALLKVLEEPPGFAHLFLLTTNAGELIPTIRSRCVNLRLAALPVSEIEAVLAKQAPLLTSKQRSLVARLSQGALGKARGFDLLAYSTVRQNALTLLKLAQDCNDHAELFKISETFRAGAEGKEKTTALVRCLNSLLQDLMYLKAGTPELARNIDIVPELERLARGLEVQWLERASRELDDLESGMRRNLLRSLAIDSFALSLES